MDPEGQPDGKLRSSGADDTRIRIAGIDIEWRTQEGSCTFEGLPVAMMWIDTTLMGLMSGVQAMVGKQRFALAQQSEGRRSVEADWRVISRFPDFRQGFEAIARIAAVAGWGVWRLVSLDTAGKKCCFRVWNSWEGRYQKALGVCWSSGMVAGKLAGYCSNLFGTNCWATQTSFIAEGHEFDEFEVAPSARTVENELARLLETDNATRADMAVALEKLRSEIAERERAEEERAKLEEQLRQSQKLEAIGRLAGGVAHDFNNILTGVIGYAELIMASMRTDDPLRAELEEIRKAGERGASLTNQLLAFSRKQLIDPKVIELKGILEGFQRMLGRIIGEDIELAFACAESLWRIKADPVQIDQILVNLAVNARDAMSDGGRLSVEARNVSLDAAHCEGQSEITPGDYVMLVVTDTGHGMDDETMSHVFEPFFSTKEAEKGTGLGLATVYGIVKQNGGFVDVHSEIGVGTSFTVYFPRTLGEADDLRMPDVVGRLTGSETILLVEDEGMVRSLASRILTRYGYTVLEAGSSKQALELESEHPGGLHMLVTDVIMPEMNGKELYARLTQSHPNLKVLFMSGYTDEVIADHGVLEKETQFVQKPFSIEFLVKRVREVLDS